LRGPLVVSCGHGPQSGAPLSVLGIGGRRIATLLASREPHPATIGAKRRCRIILLICSSI
jgi:hypothetical protein